ncbi:MAG: tRNA (adenosine(37)-N6)-dimethylallyltransferase MiaA [Pseudomonadota bacterium]
MTDPVIHIVAGPTASGKSGFALTMAQRMNGVVINADSLQIYDALPILTAQPDAVAKASVPHVLYGTLSPLAQSTAAQWADMAVVEIEKALAQGLTPIVTGGTGLYLKVLMDGLSDIPGVSDTVRHAARDDHAQMGSQAFYDRLKIHDAVMANQLQPGDSQRVIRAWEVLQETGKSLSYWQSLPPIPLRPQWRYDVTLILPPRDVLYQRCNQRFDHMLQAGALAEVEEIAAQVSQGAIPSQAACLKALGYRELAAHLSGDMTWDDAGIQAKQLTRNYAKRQVTWFTGQMRERARTRVQVIAG